MYVRQQKRASVARSWSRPKDRRKGDLYMEPRDIEILVGRRKKEGLTQRQLATLCKCSQAAISALENGKLKTCSVQLATQISKCLKRDVEELFLRHEDARLPRMTNAAGSKRQLVAA